MWRALYSIIMKGRTTDTSESEEIDDYHIVDLLFTCAHCILLPFYCFAIDSYMHE